MKQVLVLASTTGYQVRSFGDAAKAARVQLIFATDRCDQLDDPWSDRAIPIRFHDEEDAVRRVVAAFAGGRPDGIVAVGDRPVPLAARLNQAFGLTGHPVEAAAATRNKLRTRRAMAAARLAVPDFRELTLAADPTELSRTIDYPVVVKPLAMSGSRGVIRVNDAAELVAAVERLRALTAQLDVRMERDPAHQTLIVERFIPGDEFAIEGLLNDGVLRVFAIFDKPDPLDGPFFEEAIYVTPSRQPASAQKRITAAVAAAAAAIGLRHGPVHAECRLNEREVVVLEVAARPIGGLCSRALAFTSSRGTLTSLEEVILRHAIGQDVSGFTLTRGASGVMMIPIPQRGVYKGVDGIEAARQVHGVTDVRITAKPGVTLVPLPEGRSYLGFIFARAETSGEVVSALKAAHQRLRFDVTRAFVVASF